MKKYLVFIVPLLVLIVILYIALDRQGFGEIETEVVEEITVSDETINDLNRELHQAVSDSDATGATVALAQNGSIMYNNYYGVADRSSGTAISYANGYRVGELSQMVTYISFAKLACDEEAPLDLDAPVTDFLPDFVMADDRYQGITLRMLLMHKSGIPDSGESDQPAAETLIALQDTALASDPGTEVLYSKENYDLLELVLEKVYGASFTAYQENKTFTIIKMKASFYADDQDSHANIPPVYDENGLEEALVLNYAYASEGLYTNAIDLCLLSNAFNSSRQYLTKEMINAMYEENWGLMDQDLSFLDELGVSGFKMTDLTADSSAYFFYLPEQRLSLALTVQGYFENGEEILQDLLVKILQENGYPQS